MTAKPSASGPGNQFCGAQARKSAGIDESSCTCFVHSWVMLGLADASPVVDTWNKDTEPTLLAIANRFLFLGWKCRSKTAYGTAILWIWDLRAVSGFVMRVLCLPSS